MYQTQNGTTKPRVRVRVKGRYSGPSESLFDSQFERQLPPEILAELTKESAPRIYLREAPQTLQPAPTPPPPVVFRPPPVPPSPPFVAPSPAKPSQREPRSGTGIWLLMATLIGLPLLLARLGEGTLPHSPPVEVRRALPVVEVRKALPAVPRALPATSRASYVPSTGWQSVRMPDGSVVPVWYEGELPSSASLPPQGSFIGQEYSTGNTAWVWMIPAGAHFPSWVDP